MAIGQRKEMIGDKEMENEVLAVFKENPDKGFTEDEILGEVLLRRIRKITNGDPEKWLATIRWKEGVQCPRCHSKLIGGIQTRRQRWYQCSNCHYQFSATTGTWMHRSHLPVEKWLLALMISDEYTIEKLAEILQVQYRTAWSVKQQIKKQKERESEPASFQA